MASASDEYLTPSIIADAFEELGGVQLDPCSNWHSIVRARTRVMTPTNYAQRDSNGETVVIVGDGLEISWAGHGLTFVNFPYSWPRPWVEKASTADEAILLAPVDTSTAWWQDHATRAHAILFWRERLRHLKYDPVKNAVVQDGPARFASALLYWGKRPATFADVFVGCGWCVAPRYADVARM